MNRFLIRCRFHTRRNNSAIGRNNYGDVFAWDFVNSIYGH